MTSAQQPAPPPKRSKARNLIPLGLGVWLVLEIWLLVVVGNAAGGFTVLALLVGAAVLGAVVIKSAGRRAFRNFQNLTRTLQRQQQAGGAVPPEDPEEVAGSGRNGFLMLGGVLIMVPGLITDVVGLLLLLPWVRSMVGRFTERSLERRMRAAMPGSGSLGDAFQQARMRQPDGKVVQGEVIKDGERTDRPRRDDDEGPRPPLNP
ncbi:membrane protein [Streptomyces sp. 150FB]|uniref:FxsA family membrane protein n=1 Tax=Streptomyces sp. 150FB TaxID=1576605 RepID=UPI0005894654|nr:FxsA family membrane protein [Streptomyces sp. 150FB]KIF73481.1 membrane protein [Streptomyces sp. 150FB]